MKASDAGKMQPKQQDERHQHRKRVFEYGIRYIFSSSLTLQGQYYLAVNE